MTSFQSYWELSGCRVIGDPVDYAREAYAAGQRASENTEEKLLNGIFRDRTWNGNAGEYLVEWCEHCGTFIIGCLAGCRGTSCNGGGCEHCVPDHRAFNACKTSPFDYLSAEERIAWRKIESLKRLIPRSLKLGHKEIDWALLEEVGALSKADEELFRRQLESEAHRLCTMASGGTA